MRTVIERTPLQLSLSVACRQHGALAHRQATAAGLTEHQLRGLVARGEWRRPVRGVYIVEGSPDTWLQRTWVACLAAEDATASHITAAAVHGLCAPSLLPHITLPPSSSARCRAARIHRGVVSGVDRAHRDGLVLTSVSRTIVDVAALLPRPPLEEIVDDAFCRRLATAASVAAAADRVGRGRRGLQLLRAVIDVWTPGIVPGSVAEVRLFRLLGDLGLAEVVTQHEIRDDDGVFVARVDAAVPSRRLALEYEGVEAHNPRRWAGDEPRYARLRAVGWRVEPVTKLDLLPGERRLRDLVASLATNPVR